MKKSNCNSFQQRAWSMVSEVYSELIGGFENTMMDYEESDIEYQQAQEYLTDPELNRDLYQEVINRLGWSDGAKEMRFASKAFIMERINRRLTKDGYVVPNWTRNENL